MTDRPDVFVSFAWESDAVRDRVRILVGMLRGCGLVVLHDETDASAALALADFEEQGIREARKVVCVCTERWSGAYNGRSGWAHGGVRREAGLIKDRAKEAGNFSWAEAVLLPGGDIKHAPSDVGRGRCHSLPDGLGDLVRNLARDLDDRLITKDLEHLWRVLDALRTCMAADPPDVHHRSGRDAIDALLSRSGSAFPDEVRHAGDLSRWAAQATWAFRHHAHPQVFLRTLACDLIDVLADAGLQDAAIVEWAVNDDRGNNIVASRRPWAAALQLAPSSDGLVLTRAHWVRPGDVKDMCLGVGLALPDVPKWLDAQHKKYLPEAVRARDTVVRFDLPFSHLAEPVHQTPARRGQCLWRHHRAVAIWPHDTWGPIRPAWSKGCCVPCVQATPEHPPKDIRGRAVRWSPGDDSEVLLTTHDGCVLTAAVAGDPAKFAERWCEKGASVPIHHAFDAARTTLLAGEDVVILWTDENYAATDFGEALDD